MSTPTSPRPRPAAHSPVASDGFGFPTLDEIVEITHASDRPTEKLMEVVRLTAERFHVDVCSIYLLEPDRLHLVLAATVGLRPEGIGHVRMGLDEGLAGLAADELRPVAVEQARRHPRYKYFSEAGEEAYESFLGVPLTDRGVLHGVLVVQTVEARTFGNGDIQFLSEVAARVGPVVSEARVLEQRITPVSEKLWTLARNLWWSWDPEARSVFRDIDPVRWLEIGQNPIQLLSEIPLRRLTQKTEELLLHSRINYAYRRQQEYLKADRTWGATHAGILRSRPVAYLSAEFGLHESLPIYSGGLGVLAGDHVKSASDLDIPLVGIGLFYSHGYFRQRLDDSGWQNEEYLRVDRTRLALEPALGTNGQPVVVSIETRTGSILAKVWRLAVGRSLVFLLDSDMPGNAPEDRELTARLYGGDSRVRIRQELLLGIGGVRALHAMGILPSVFHLNEGHSAFAVLEVIRERMVDEGLSFAEAARRVHRRVVFTTHTPVPAGHDRFSQALIDEHLNSIREGLGLSPEELMALGRVHPADDSEEFCMTVLALRLSRRANAVSSLHGEVSRSMWNPLWPDRSEEEVPIGHITNGVHVPTWLAPQMVRLYEKNLGPGWYERCVEPKTWEGVEDIDDGELWETHLALKARLLEFVRRRTGEQARRSGKPPVGLDRLGRGLSPDALTLGFARRFATYKRANLILRDIDRLSRLANDPKRPVQFIFAGKAHPRDEPGKTVLREIVDLTKGSPLEDRIVFVEDYDIDVGRHLVQGVDVWVNTPRRPFEASGTSGQKVLLNGGLNLSVLDGWWAEAYDGSNGFAIGTGRTHSDPALHDLRDGEELYRVLEEEVIPLYYQRDSDGLPRSWIRRVKRAIRTLGWRFNANRMVIDYTRNCYIPAAGGTSSRVTRDC